MRYLYVDPNKTKTFYKRVYKMNTNNDVIIRRLNVLLDRYEMRKTGKSYFAVRNEREKRERRLNNTK